MRDFNKVEWKNESGHTCLVTKQEDGTYLPQIKILNCMRVYKDPRIVRKSSSINHGTLLELTTQPTIEEAVIIIESVIPTLVKADLKAKIRSFCSSVDDVKVDGVPLQNFLEGLLGV